MATIGSWIEALRRLQKAQFNPRTTTQTYLKIRDLGLKSAEWITLEISSANEKEIEKFLDTTEKFIAANAPCLFIFDPKTSALKKGYFVDVADLEPVKKWLEENKKNLPNYYYLITSQIADEGNGIIGSVFSDGKGKMFCETLHLRSGSSHRLLSQPKEDISKNLTILLLTILNWKARE